MGCDAEKKKKEKRKEKKKEEEKQNTIVVSVAFKPPLWFIVSTFSVPSLLSSKSVFLNLCETAAR